MTGSRMGVLAAGITCLTLLPLQAFAVSQAGTSGASFLELEQGARPLGMGGAYSAVADDALAVWWNPGGIARSSATEVSLSYAAFIEDISTQFLGFTRALSEGRGTIGASLTYLTIPGIPSASSINGNPTEGADLTANSYAASLAYGRMIYPDLSVGANAKFFGQTLDANSGEGFALDIGAQYLYKSLRMGLALQNLGPSFKIADDSNPLPQDIRVGLAYPVHPRILLALDEEKARDTDLRTHVGAEATVTSYFTVRAGYEQVDNDGSGAGVTAGFSLLGVLRGEQAEGSSIGFTPMGSRSVAEVLDQGGYLVSLDYAFMSFGNVSNTNRVTISVKF
jgi:hypothetical protein